MAADAETLVTFENAAPIEAWRDAAVICLSIHGLLLLTPLLGANTAAIIVWECFAGVGVAAGGMIVLHDAVHERFAATHKWVNIVLVHAVLPIGLGVDRRTRQHLPVHHTFTGVYPIDEFTDTSWMLRTHPAAPWRTLHQYQHLYVWFAYALMWPIDQASQIRALARHDDGLRSPGRRTRVGSFLIEHLLSLSVLTPYAALLGPQRLVVLLIPALLLGGFITATVLVVGHINEGLSLPVADLPPGTSLHQACRTTASFSVNSPFLAWMTGGLSRHLAHHVFPSARRGDLGQLNDALTKIARRDLGIDPVVYDTFRAAVRGHYRALRSLGHAPAGRRPVASNHDAGSPRASDLASSHRTEPLPAVT